MHTNIRASRIAVHLAALVLSGALTACGAAAPATMTAPEAAAPMPAAMPAAPEAKFADNSAQSAAGVVERMIVRNADLTLVVADVEAQFAAISAIAKKHGGFVVSSSIDRYEGPVARTVRGNASLRVDSEKLDQALADLRALAIEVSMESSSGQDVTGEFVDLQAQLTNLEAAEKQLQKLMEQATRTEDVLNVFNQLTQIRGQIEQIKGRMKYLSESAALSLINVQLISDAASQPIEPTAWRPLGTAKTALDALINSLKWLADVVIYLAIAVVPVLLLIGLPIFFVMRLIARRSRRLKLEGVRTDKASSSDAAQPPQP